MVLRAANNEFPVIDGIAPSWADVVVKISPTGAALIEMKDIKSVNSSRSVEVGTQKGGGRVMKRTTGDSSQEASMTLYYDGYIKLLRGIKGLAPLRGNTRLVSLVTFDIQVQYTPPGSVEIFDRRWKGCRIIGDTANGAEGTDANEVEVPLSVIEIVDIVDGEEVALL